MRAGLAELGRAASLGVAATPRAALWLARGRGEALDALDLSVTGLETSLLAALGVRTIGELRRLPRDGLAKRCGRDLVEALERALGERAEPREFFLPPASFDVALELPGGGVTQAEAVLFSARRLLVELQGRLAARHAGIRSFVLVLKDFKGKESTIEVRLASPGREAERLTKVLREKLAGVVLREPVEAIRVRAGEFVPLAGHSGAMFGDAAAEGEDWARLLERLQARLGAGAVHGLTAQPDHRPEHAWRSVEPGEWDPREYRAPGPRPAWLLEAPRRIAHQDLHLLAGPERIECGWWDGDEARRDYFVARREAALVWVYREGDGWYLHGLFA